MQHRLGLNAGDLEVIRAMPLFAGLHPNQLAAVLGSASVRSFQRGNLLFMQGDAADRFYVVLEGWVRLSRSMPDGGEVTIAIFGRGQSLAEAVILEMGTYPVTGQVVAPSRLLIVPGDSFIARLRENADLCLNMMASMSRHLLHFLQEIEQLSTRSTVERVALFLLHLTPVEAGPCSIELPLDKTFIAARLGMQPETLSRAFAKLRQHGVEVHGSTVQVADVARLRTSVSAEAD